MARNGRGGEGKEEVRVEGGEVDEGEGDGVERVRMRREGEGDSCQ